MDLFTRVLFSALVDADALDAEEHEGSTGGVDARENRTARAFAWADLVAYDRALTAFMAEKQRLAARTAVNALRRRVLDACIASAPSPRGAYSLTVPTGGGKTLASLAFALKHAVANGQRRVVIAVPFTAIIDQTAQVLRGAFDGLAGDVLVEHHSALEPDSESAPARVAADNWDAPLIVTTQVQLFESLFSNRPSKCRKLHNLANSVIILDEVQSLPHGVLAPILDVLNDLVANYGVTLLLTTATQPSLHRRTLGGASFLGLSPKPAEIISDGLQEDLWTSIRRVDVKWPSLRGGGDNQRDPAEFWQRLATELAGHTQVLAIVHLKMDARALHQAVSATSADSFHLSAAMCPAHRREVLGEVRGRLVNGGHCRLVSTAADRGRSRRGFPGGLPGHGRTRVARAERRAVQPRGEARRPGFVLRVHSPEPSATVPATSPGHCCVDVDGRASARPLLADDVREVLDQVYAARTLDVREVQALRAALRFESTARAFRMIDERTEAIVVCWDDTARRLVRELRYAGANRTLLRRLQPYTVSVFPQQRTALERQSVLEDVHGYAVLGDFTNNPFYHPQLGLLTEADPSVSLVF